MSNRDSSDDALEAPADDLFDDADGSLEEAAQTQPTADGLSDVAPEDDPQPTAAPARSRVGLLLFGAAGALWAAFGLMRCDTDEPLAEPTAAVVSPDESRPPSASPPESAQRADAPSNLGAEPASATESLRADAKPSPDDDPAPNDAAFDPRPSAAAWARNLRAPEVVKYVVRRGGSIKNVANLYKIFHHEIEALNPGVPLEHNLPPRSPVIVYRANNEAKSASVGLPSNGSLEGGVPMMDGPGRIMKMIGWKSFATANTVALLDAVLRRWAQNEHPQPVIVGNMSSRKGGKLAPHSTHQSGRDVDLGYPQILPTGEELNWRVMNAKNLDPKETWALLSILVQTGQVEMIFIDRELQKLLYDYAKKTNTLSKRVLAKWMEYPAASGSGSPIIQHVSGHVDHLHVRFKCQPHETQCRSRSR